MRFKVACSLSYRITTDATFIFNVEVAKVVGQSILSEKLTIRPSILQNAYTDLRSGNRYFGLNVAPGEFDLDYAAEVDLEVYRADPMYINETTIGLLPLNVMPFLLPSRFVPSDRLMPFARAEFGALPLGHRRVTAICNWIHDHLEYHPGSSDEQTIASETLLKRAGICRDFAHLGVAFCRGLAFLLASSVAMRMGFRHRTSMRSSKLISTDAGGSLTPHVRRISMVLYAWALGEMPPKSHSQPLSASFSRHQ